MSVDNLSKAVFVVNKHAKTAPNPKFLYTLKKRALEKLISEDKAKKIGLHFSRNPNLSKQTSTVLISCGSYLFHILPVKEDFQNLPHLGSLEEQYRNPKTYLSLKQAKALLMTYTGIKEPQPNNPFGLQASKNYISPFAKRPGER
ncbi:YkyB family protein [Ureibacillus sinduriensis]|uniref:YkyB-like protein n=1 Tax=Ureibacillus sinduriensis BLB-1 = JCM 15800 TaxID=1384057 RepID=A0A0A3HYR9_9BACL|nr:YkyB family protein [Ureibacillus sinduriensis]KGR76390.1 hypothetical protein CD33_07585 [Ureibacillus sinduriensis BLB-1 = JCM 15800]